MISIDERPVGEHTTELRPVTRVGCDLMAGMQVAIIVSRLIIKSHVEQSKKARSRKPSLVRGMKLNRVINKLMGTFHT